MFSSLVFKNSNTVGFISRQARAISSSLPTLAAGKGQAEVILVGCGAPNRGMYLKREIIYKHEEKYMARTPTVYRTVDTVVFPL